MFLLFSIFIFLFQQLDSMTSVNSNIIIFMILEMQKHISYKYMIDFIVSFLISLNTFRCAIPVVLYALYMLYLLWYAI